MNHGSIGNASLCKPNFIVIAFRRNLSHDTVYLTDLHNTLCKEITYPLGIKERMTTGDKLKEEVQSLEREIELINKASTTGEACKAIAQYTTAKEADDPFLSHSGENPYLAAPSTGGGCCVVA